MNSNKKRVRYLFDYFVCAYGYWDYQRNTLFASIFEWAELAMVLVLNHAQQLEQSFYYPFFITDYGQFQLEIVANCSLKFQQDFFSGILFESTRSEQISFLKTTNYDHINKSQCRWHSHQNAIIHFRVQSFPSKKLISLIESIYRNQQRDKNLG